MSELPRNRTTAWHYAPNNSWDRERIVIALKVWARETGAPPKSLDWCPSSGRSAGLTGPEPTKWELEHPRWPGSTTVYRYFESWSEALEDAGLPLWTRRRRYRSTVAERVEAAKRMHADGASTREIADHLEVGWGTAHNYLRAHPCEQCSGPVVRDGRLCHPCSTRQANPRRWSEEDVLAAARDWRAETGRWPTSLDWKRPQLGEPETKWSLEFPRWPPASIGKIVFGTWNELRLAMGAEPYQPPWLPEEILDAIRRWEREHGRVPKKGEWEIAPKGFPSAATVRRSFGGSFNAAVAAAGLQPHQKNWSAERVALALAQFAVDHGRPARPKDLEAKRASYPTSGTVYNRFKTWEAALEAAAQVDQSAST